MALLVIKIDHDRADEEPYMTSLPMKESLPLSMFADYRMVSAQARRLVIVLIVVPSQVQSLKSGVSCSASAPSDHFGVDTS